MSRNFNCLSPILDLFGRGRTNAFGVYIGHEICHRVPVTSATLLSREAITMAGVALTLLVFTLDTKSVIACLRQMQVRPFCRDRP